MKTTIRIISYHVLFFRFCGGLILDIKRKTPFFFSDFYDALHIQSLSAILFIYLGTVTNAITFGGLLGDATENMQVKIRLRTMKNCMSLRLRRALCAWVFLNKNQSSLGRDYSVIQSRSIFNWHKLGAASSLTSFWNVTSSSKVMLVS